MSDLTPGYEAALIEVQRRRDERNTPPDTHNFPTEYGGDPDLVVREQVEAAIALAKRDFTKQPRLPWDSLHDRTGFLLPGEFWAVAAHPGNGKSTFLMSLVAGWAEAGVRCYVLSLENEPEVMRRYLAALRLGYEVEAVLSNDYGALPDGADTELLRELSSQSEVPARDLVRFSPAPFLDPLGVVAEIQQAASVGADVVLIDHLNRVETSGYDAHVAMIHQVREVAKHTGLPVVGAVQFNDRLSGGSRLAPYMPPRAATIKGGQHILEEAAVVLGLYRPLSDEVDTKVRRDIETGMLQATEYLEPNAIGVVILKHRIRGRYQGSKLNLTYQAGRISCPQTQERAAIEERIEEYERHRQGDVFEDWDPGAAQ